MAAARREVQRCVLLRVRGVEVRLRALTVRRSLPDDCVIKLLTTQAVRVGVKDTIPVCANLAGPRIQMARIEFGQHELLQRCALGIMTQPCCSQGQT